MQTTILFSTFLTLNFLLLGINIIVLFSIMQTEKFMMLIHTILYDNKLSITMPFEFSRF